MRELARYRCGQTGRMLHPPNFVRGGSSSATWSAAFTRPATWLLFDRAGICLDALIGIPAHLPAGVTAPAGLHFQQLLPAAVVPLAEGLWATLRAGGIPGSVSCVHEAGAELRRVELPLAPSRAGNVAVHFREAKAAATPVADPNRRLHLAVQAARQAISEWDVEGGNEPEGWHGKRWELPEDLPEATPALKQALEHSLANDFQ